MMTRILAVPEACSGCRTAAATSEWPGFGRPGPGGGFWAAVSHPESSSPRHSQRAGRGTGRLPGPADRD